MVDRHELCAVGKGAFDLDLVEHLRHTLHHVAAVQYGDAEGHEVGDAPAVADALEHFGGDEGQGFRGVELESPPAPPARDLRRGGEQELVPPPGGPGDGPGESSLDGPA